jgi:phosphoribosyl 1,2-cyclic phosphodiesterase
MDEQAEVPELIVSSFGSGSNGNAFLIEFDTTRILVDSGVPIRTLISCLSQRTVMPADLIAILVSHEHIDHVRSLRQLTAKSSVPVLATRGTLAGIEHLQITGTDTISSLKSTEIGPLLVTPIAVSHDAREPVGFHLQSPAGSVTLFTDLGEYSADNMEFASQADHVVIESNYDESMLRAGSYPAHLKRRIRSADGHLSNDDCAEFLCEVVNSSTSDIWLCHLSENNNRPDNAERTTTEALRKCGIHQSVTALPRYDGRVTTWRSSQKSQPVQQSRFLF